MKTTKKINISEFGLEIEVDDTGGGWITSKMKEACPYCGENGCYSSCDESQYASDVNEESEDNVENRKSFNTSIDALESLILAHACAGIDVEAYGYVEGIRTALQAISKEYED
jgi:hypothetical protein